MKTAFIQNVSHEIRTPLNILSGFSQLLAMPDIELPLQTRQEASEKIQENTRRITTLVNQLLELSDTVSRAHLERNDIVPINQLCQKAIAESRIGDTQCYHFTFNTQVDDEAMIKTSEHFIVKAIAHLLENAIKFTPEHGDIRLNCKTEGDLLLIEVEDTGCGVPPEKAEDIFGEFVQLDEYKDGVGIGLSVSRNIARRLGGDISLDTAYAAGARFVLTLPLS
jgi:signal transduction histidine kinase